MEDEKETQNPSALDYRLTRRSLVQALLAGGVYSGIGAPGFGAAFQQGSQKRPDVGTIYDQVMKIADQANYPLSYLTGNYSSPDAYRRIVREKTFELFHYDPPAVNPEPEIVQRWEYDDYIQERVLFNTVPWFRIPAYVLIPRGYSGPRPGIVDLHSHGGLFVFGKEKVMPMPEGDHPSISEYRRRNYDGRSTSLELCRRGYVVVSIDCFYFGERRSLFDDDEANYGWDRSRYSQDDVQYLNRRSARGEGILACSLYWAGTTWQGIAHIDDIRTVDYLVSRPEVDPERIGCLGISMGGDRTDYLAGLDDRIRCAVSIGWMSTLRPMIRNHVLTHSFMHFLPGLTHYIDLPDLLGCMVPKPLMVQYCSQDALYPLEGMEESAEKLAAIYSKANAADNFRAEFYDRPHIF
ncbi:MAG TPA: alpha/beta hydrolase family protein, partial [Acidobacteriota bacterium]|nr:alpha/beta hydrolase family protein [Acidobacteriota bacterium]